MAIQNVSKWELLVLEQLKSVTQLLELSSSGAQKNVLSFVLYEAQLI